MTVREDRLASVHRNALLGIYLSAVQPPRRTRRLDSLRAWWARLEGSEHGRELVALGWLVVYALWFVAILGLTGALPS